MTTNIRLTNVDLGFLESITDGLNVFSSKIGGKPYWLNVERIPKLERFQCKKCQTILLFLGQIYAPLDDVPDAFHRVIYIFVCPISDCWKPNQSDNFLALRCQLPRENKFYSPQTGDPLTDPKIIPVKLCTICGLPGPYQCSACKAIPYCSKEHQRIDWKNGHKEKCSQPTNSLMKYQSILLPEYELLTEAEEEDPATDLVADQMKDFDELIKSGKVNSELNSLDESEFKCYAGDEDLIFGRFKKRIEGYEDQVLRHERGGKPLWISKHNQLTEDAVPPCGQCGSKRIFEFQIMPQLLNSLKKFPTFDWGVLVVYTCEAGCITTDSTDDYIEEYVYKQDIIDEKKEDLGVGSEL